MEVPEIGQEVLIEDLLSPQEFDILIVKVQLLNVLHHLLQACRNGKAAAIWNIPEENVKIGDLLAKARL